VGTDGLAYTFNPTALKVSKLEILDLYRISLDIHDDYKKAEELIGLAARSGEGRSRAEAIMPSLLVLNNLISFRSFIFIEQAAALKG
jgi:hypothetical protein